MRNIVTLNKPEKTTKGIKRIIVGLGAVACGITAASANITINDINDDFAVTWNYSPFTGAVISALGTFDVVGISTTQLVMNVKLTNQSSGFSNAGIKSFGFNINPNATSASANTLSAYDTLTDSDRIVGALLNNLPAIAAIDVCFYAVASNNPNCNGGGQTNLLAIGETDYFTITINENFPGATVDFLDVTSNDVVGTGLMGLKIQTNEGSFELTGIVKPPSGGDDPLPTPGIAALLGLGLLGLRKLSVKSA
jgi:hypothetical protein